MALTMSINRTFTEHYRKINRKWSVEIKLTIDFDSFLKINCFPLNFQIVFECVKYRRTQKHVHCVKCKHSEPLSQGHANIIFHYYRMCRCLEISLLRFYKQKKNNKQTEDYAEFDPQSQDAHFPMNIFFQNHWSIRHDTDSDFRYTFCLMLFDLKSYLHEIFNHTDRYKFVAETKEQLKIVDTKSQKMKISDPLKQFTCLCDDHLYYLLMI